MKAYNNGETHYNVYDSSGQLAHTERHLANGQVHTKTDYRAAGMRISRFLKIYDHLGDLAGYNTVYYHSDHLGSPVLATNVNGTERWRESYTPFGETLTSPADNDNQAGFTGHIKDSATGLTYMQARYHDPVMGRFLSVDPVTFNGTNNTGFFNRYAYTFNDPVNMIDPNGEEAWLISRPILNRAAHHAFVVVVNDKGLVTAQFSYRPQKSGLGNHGKLVSRSSKSRLGQADRKAFNTFQWNEGIAYIKEITAVKINASDATVTAAGNSVNEALGTRSEPGVHAPNYAPIPNGLKGEANSNSAANAVRTISEAAEGKQPSNGMPSGGWHPGANNQNNVPSAGFSISGEVIYGTRGSGSRIHEENR